MIEVWLIIGMACMEHASACLIPAHAQEAPISSWDQCIHLADTMPPAVELAVKGLVVEAKCEKRKKEEPKEEEK